MFFFGLKSHQKATCKGDLQWPPHCKTGPQTWAILLPSDNWHNLHFVESLNLILSLSLSLPPPIPRDHNHHVGALHHHALHLSSTFINTYDMIILEFACSL